MRRLLREILLPAVLLILTALPAAAQECTEAEYFGLKAGATERLQPGRMLAAYLLTMEGPTGYGILGHKYVYVGRSGEKSFTFTRQRTFMEEHVNSRKVDEKDPPQTIVLRWEGPDQVHSLDGNRFKLSVKDGAVYATMLSHPKSEAKKCT